MVKPTVSSNSKNRLYVSLFLADYTSHLHLAQALGPGGYWESSCGESHQVMHAGPEAQGKS